MLRVTRHARMRSKERFGIKGKAAERLAERALLVGLSRSDVTGKLARYFDELYARHKKGNNIRVYAGKIFVFHDDVLLTVMPLPESLIKVVAEIRRGN